MAGGFLFSILYRAVRDNLLNLQAAEAGDLDNFTRLYQGDNSRLMVTDARGRTAAHLAAAKNRVNILQYIYTQQGSEYCTELNLKLSKSQNPIQLRFYGFI